MSGQAVCCIGDMSVGACGKPAIPALTSTADGVLVNGRVPVVVGSYWNTHCDGDDCHSEYAVIGNDTVLVNGKPIVTIGHVLMHGDIPGTGSYNVFA